MPITFRPHHERGKGDHGWLSSRHTFSFADYFDRSHMAFRSLRVLNDDRVAPGRGFGKHPHRDMEIVTWVVEGAIVHEDSMGNRAVLAADHLQRMRAGTGVFHSEWNASDTRPLRFLQMWVLPERQGLSPGYAERSVPAEERAEGWVLALAPDGEGGAVDIAQDARLYLTRLLPGVRRSFSTEPGRGQWLQVISGEVHLGGALLQEGDGVAIEEEEGFEVQGASTADVLLWDLGPVR